jgi:hypothetical protein
MAFTAKLHKRNSILILPDTEVLLIYNFITVAKKM